MAKYNISYSKSLEKPERKEGDGLDRLYMEQLPLGEIKCGGWLAGAA